MTPPIPETTNHEVVYKGYFDVNVDLLQSHKGELMSYTSINLKVHAAAVLARTKEGKLVINKEYRHPTGKWLLSCPGGRIDEGESPLEAAERELREETGYIGGKAALIGNVFPLPAVTDQIIHYVFIDQVEPNHKSAREPFELIQTELINQEELFKEIAQGASVDGVLCTALLLSKISGMI